MPIDRGIIDQQLEALGESTLWWNQRELRDLPTIMQPGETILALSRGKIARVRWLRRTWLIVVTNLRLLCVASARHSGWRHLEVKTDQITRVTFRIGLFKGRVFVYAHGHRYRLLVPRMDAYKLHNVLSGFGAHEIIAGFGPARMMRRVMEHMLALPAAALDPSTPRIAPPKPAPPRATDADHVHALEAEVEELRRQVEFLEELLGQKQQLNAK